MESSKTWEEVIFILFDIRGLGIQKVVLKKQKINTGFGKSDYGELKILCCLAGSEAEKKVKIKSFF